MYIPRKVFSVGQWDTFRFLLEFEEVEIRGSSFAFFVCFDQGVLSYLLERVGRGEVSHLLFADDTLVL